MEWSFQLWNTITEQAVITFNTLRTSRINPKKSAYHQLHGKRYDWNRFPLAPPGTRAVLYLDPDNRSSWGTRGIYAWYCGTSNDHYICNKFYVPEKDHTVSRDRLIYSHSIAASRTCHQNNTRMLCMTSSYNPSLPSKNLTSRNSSSGWQMPCTNWWPHKKQHQFKGWLRQKLSRKQNKLKGWAKHPLSKLQQIRQQ